MQLEESNKRFFVMNITILIYCGGKRYLISFSIFFFWVAEGKISLTMQYSNLQKMEMFKKPSTVHLVKRLTYSNLLGLDVKLKNGR